MSDQPNIESRIKDIIVDQLGVDSSVVVPAANFVEDLGADSLDQVEILMGVEEEFDIEIEDADAEKLTTVQLLTDYVTARV